MSVYQYANYMGNELPQYDECIVNFDYAPRTLYDAFLVSIVMVPLMTLWRLAFSSMSKPLSLGFVSVESGISVSKLKTMNIEQHPKLLELSHKYCEELWKCITMSCITLFGIYVVYNEKWISDSRWLYIQYPQSFPKGIEYYYYLDWGYHGHRLIFQFFDSKRKDFWATMIHHWITIWLIIFSYCLGFTELGAFVMLVHDNTDAILSLAKVIKYSSPAKWIADAGFAFFAVSWVVSRDIIFAVKIVFPTYFDAYPMYSGCYQYWFWYCGFEGGLFGLWCLHLYWTIFLFKAIYRILFKGDAIHDPRSDKEKPQ